MSAPKPTLGYPTRSAAALALREQGLSYRQIGAELGVSSNAASGLCVTARRKRSHFNLRVCGDTARALRREADIRGVTVGKLVNGLLAAIARDGLVGAVLDDAGDGGSPE